MSLRRTLTSGLLAAWSALTLALPAGNSTHLPTNSVPREHNKTAPVSPPLRQSQNLITSVTLYGDSLSDIGNVQLLLEILRGSKDPSLIFKPFNASLKYSGIEKFLNYMGVSNREIKYMEYHFIAAFISVLKKAYKLPVFPDSEYYLGRFSNGPVWNEWLAQWLGVPVYDKTKYINRAYGGSWAINFMDDIRLRPEHLVEDIKRMIDGKLIPPDLVRLVNAYMAEYPDEVNKEHYPEGGQLFVFLYGGNDYLNGETDVDKVTERITEQVERTAQYLSKAPSHWPNWITVANLPPLERAPRYLEASLAIRQKTRLIIQSHNSLLKKKSEALKTRFEGKVRIRFIDTYRIANEELDSGEYANTRDACYNNHLPALLFGPSPTRAVWPSVSKGASVKPCKHPEDYAFWDKVHPTAKMHARIAWRVCHEEVFQEMGAACPGTPPDFQNPEAFPPTAHNP
ncbi:MAG: SGNH/GDSL hydrolase family protein [Endozoicomonas sp.]